MTLDNALAVINICTPNEPQKNVRGRARVRYQTIVEQYTQVHKLQLDMASPSAKEDVIPVVKNKRCQGLTVEVACGRLPQERPLNLPHAFEVTVAYCYRSVARFNAL